MPAHNPVTIMGVDAAGNPVPISSADGVMSIAAASPRTLTTAIIAINENLSAAVDLGEGQSLVGLQMGAAWTTAPISLQVSADGVTYTPLYNSDGALVQQAAPAVSSGYNLPAAEMVGWRYVKIQSGVPGTLVNQAAARTIGLVTRSLA